MAAHDEPADVLIIGSGATGSIAAKVLAEAGLKSSASSRAAGSSPRTTRTTAPTGSGSAARAGAPTSTSARAMPTTFRSIANSSQVLMWNGVGGSTNVYGALWPRYRPSDFRKGTEHGLQPDWPIAYEDVAPYYEQADALIGVSGPGGRSGHAAVGRLSDAALADAARRPPARPGFDRSAGTGGPSRRA